MDIVLNRRGGVPVRDQIVTQLELKILSGDLVQGQRLPSVRSLARRLKVHHNTVSAAYQDLAASGHVELQRGSGVFVRGGRPPTIPDARGLDEMIRLALYTAFQKGFNGAEIRAAVERWLAASPPDRVVVVDPCAEMAQLMAHEVRLALGVPASWCSLDDVAQDPRRLSGALALALPYHKETLRRLVPAAAVEVLTLGVSEKERKTIASLPAGAIVLVVSHSPTVLPFASVFMHSLRGDELLVEAQPLADPKRWRRLVAAADVVLADAVAIDAVRKARPRRLLEFRVVTDVALTALKDALTVVVPRVAGAAAGPSRRADGKARRADPS